MCQKHITQIIYIENRILKKKLKFKMNMQPYVHGFCTNYRKRQ